jgi:C4-dicarboxylate transporter, DctQ subunit
MTHFIRIIDSISEIAGRLCAWTFFAIGLCITWEVVMRYVFTAPTIWVDEVARIMQVWATYLAAAWVLKHRQMITIEVFLKDPSTTGRKLAETLAIAMLLIFATTAMYFGFQLWLKSTLAGHTTDSFLASPKWLTHSSVWVGMALLVLQAVAELYRVWFVGIPADDHDPLAELG